MKFFSNLLLLIFIGLIFSGKILRANPTLNGYTLVWSDEFSQQPDGAPDPAKWGYETGFIRNNEAQYYTNARAENARVEKGYLIIEARKESFLNPSSKGPKIAHYTSASLTTQNTARWTYGRFEMKAKLPAGKGVWPAFWMLGYNLPQNGWPRCGEIDIMELVGKEPGVIHGTVHYFGDGKHQSSGGKLSVAQTDSAFHVYAVEWNADRITFFVDDKPYFAFDVKKADNGAENPFRQPQFLILNLAIGGTWGGPIDDSIFPQRMVVDYIRVYQKL